MDGCVRCGRAHSAGDHPWRLVDEDPVCPGCLASDEYGAEPFDPSASPIEQHVATLRRGLPLGWFGRRRVAREARHHLNEAACDGQASGLTRWRAERAAVQGFGSVERLAAEYAPGSAGRRRLWGAAGAFVAAAGLAAVLLALDWRAGSSAVRTPTRPPVGHPIAGVRLLPASPARVSLIGSNKISCTRLGVILARPAAAVQLMIYSPASGAWIRLVTHHNALSGRVLNFRPWCGKARERLAPGTYPWRYEVRWTPGSRWQLPPLQEIVVVANTPN